MMRVVDPAFDPKDPAEDIFVGFDFSALTDTPSSPTVVATRHAGEADSSPSAVLSGSPSVSSGVVVQKIVGGVAGTRYLLRAECDAPDGSHYVLTGILPVRSA